MLNSKIFIAAGVAFALLLLACWFLFNQLQDLNMKYGKLEAALDQVVEVNKRNLEAALESKGFNRLVDDMRKDREKLVRQISEKLDSTVIEYSRNKEMDEELQVWDKSQIPQYIKDKNAGVVR